MGFKQSEVIGVDVRLLGSRRAGEFQKKNRPTIKYCQWREGPYQDVGNADEGMESCNLNHLLGSRQVKDLRIPPYPLYRHNILRNYFHFKKSKICVCDWGQTWERWGLSASKSVLISRWKASFATRFARVGTSVAQIGQSASLRHATHIAAPTTILVSNAITLIAIAITSTTMSINQQSPLTSSMPALSTGRWPSRQSTQKVRLWEAQ